MKNLFSLLAVFLGLGCGGAPSKQAATTSLCRVVLSDLAWTQDSYSPQIISTSARSALVGERETYQFFWLQERQLFRGVLHSPASYQTEKLSSDASIFRVTAHQDRALLAYREGEKMFLLFGGENDPLTRKIDLGEARNVESIALAAQGKTAVVLYSAQTPRGLQAFFLTVDLCPFFSGDALCYAQELLNLNAESWETTGKFTATSLGAVDPLSKGALSISPIGEREFVIGIESPSHQKKTFRLSRPEDSRAFSATEEKWLPENVYPLPGPIPFSFIPSTGETFAFYTADTASLGVKELTTSKERERIRLQDKGALRRFAAVQPTSIADPSLWSGPDTGVLWFGPDPFQRGTRQLSFALLSPKGTLREAPLSVLPGENISSASMAVLRRTDKLSFGVFYQHEDPDIELGFIQIECTSK